MDREATNVKFKDASDNDYMNLNLTRTVSNWTRVAAHRAGQTDSDTCILCGEREGSDHMWFCSALRKDREEADGELAKIEPKSLHPAIRHGIAPAMSGKLRGSFRGGDLEDMSNATKRLLGNVPEGMTPTKIKSIISKCRAEHTAREVIQHCASSWGCMKV